MHGQMVMINVRLVEEQDVESEEDYRQVSLSSDPQVHNEQARKTHAERAVPSIVSAEAKQHITRPHSSFQTRVFPNILFTSTHHTLLLIPPPFFVPLHLTFSPPLQRPSHHATQAPFQLLQHLHYTTLHCSTGAIFLHLYPSVLAPFLRPRQDQASKEKPIDKSGGRSTLC